jgi:4-alpha-glucanotransferase
MSNSAFAGNLLLIDLHELQQQGWLAPADRADAGAVPQRVDYAEVVPFRMAAAGAARRSASLAAGTGPQQRRPSTTLLPAPCRLAGRLRAVHGAERGASDFADWCDWPQALAARAGGAGARAPQHAERIAFWKFSQWCFYRQWLALKAYANGAACRSSATRRSSSPTTAPRSGPTRTCSSWTPGRPADRGGRRAAGLLQRHRPALGQPAVPLGAACPRRLRLVGAAHAPVFELVDIVRIDHFRGFAATGRSRPANRPR